MTDTTQTAPTSTFSSTENKPPVLSVTSDYKWGAHAPDGAQPKSTTPIKTAAAPARKHSPEHDMLVGGLWCVGGIIVTSISYSAVADKGGSYLVCWGAILFGGIQFLKGLAGFFGE